MTREEILSIEEYCAEHKVSSSSNASFPYTRKIHQTVQAGRGKERGQSYHRSSDRTDTAIRIQGVMTPAHFTLQLLQGTWYRCSRMA